MANKKETTNSGLAVAMKAGFKASDAKIDKLAVAMKAGFKASDKRTDAKIEKLAEMVGNGFNEMGDRINGMKHDIGSMKQDIISLKQGQDRIEMRLNNVVYRTELDAVVDRVQVLEGQMKNVLKKG